MTIRLTTLFTVLLLAGLYSTASAQAPLPFLRVSAHATVSQDVATFANVHIDYSRPKANGREVWGTLVPNGLAPNAFGNGKPMPWRAGANENTTITFSHDVKIQGSALYAGTYGLHILPSESDLTLIFSKDSKAWGSFFYEKEQDALRVKTNWQDAEHAESLTYYFGNMTPNSTDVFLHWADKRIAFTVEVDRHDVVLTEYRSRLSNLQGFNPGALAAAANYCINNNVNLEEGEAWLDRAIANGGPNFNNLMTKSRYLKLEGKETESQSTVEQALAVATEANLNAYGYTFMQATPPNVDKALEVFKSILDKFPASWNAHDSYAEALAVKGDKKNSEKYYKKALDIAPANQKARIEGILNTL